MDSLHQICSWCWREGQLTVLNGGDPMAVLLAVEDHEVSHGICSGHEAEQREQLEALKISLAGGAICT